MLYKCETVKVKLFSEIPRNQIHNLKCCKLFRVNFMCAINISKDLTRAMLAYLNMRLYYVRIHVSPKDLTKANLACVHCKSIATRPRISTKSSTVTKRV